ncbi:MAG: hypothetical protein L3J96_05330, partial [Thermoplasmata archaeon]|nr:hypothetical protein [Thermoplasmata archaeon]
LAEGRSHVLLRAAGPTPETIDELGLGFDGPPPKRGELADWVMSLVSEWAMTLSIGSDGENRYLAVRRPESEPPRIQVDAVLLEAALARRTTEEDDDPSVPPVEERDG